MKFVPIFSFMRSTEKFSFTLKYALIFISVKYESSLFIHEICTYIFICEIQKIFSSMKPYIIFSSMKLKNSISMYDMHIFFIWNMGNSMFIWNMHPQCHIWNIKTSIFIWNMHLASCMKYKKFYFHMKYAPIASYMNYQKCCFLYEICIHVFIYVIQKIDIHLWTMHPCLHIWNNKNSIFIHGILTIFSCMTSRKFYFHPWNILMIYIWSIENPIFIFEILTPVFIYETRKIPFYP